MKIVHLITSLKIGGAESALVNFLTHAKLYGHEHHVIYFHDGPNRQIIQNLNIPTYHITGIISYCDPLALYRLKKIIISLKPDLIHSSLWSANIIGRVFARYLNIPIVCDLHGDCNAEGFIRNFFDRRTVSWAQSIIAVSDTVRKNYVSSIVSSIKNPVVRENITKRVRTIKNGINSQTLVTKATENPLNRDDLGFKSSEAHPSRRPSSLYELRRTPQGERLFGTSNDVTQDFVIGSIGRLEPIKSYDVLVQAFAIMLKNITPEEIQAYGQPKLCIVGDGSEMPKIQALSKSLELNSNTILLAGFRTDAYRFYPVFDCFVLSSQSEGLSIALLEALSFGLPIITTHNDTHHEVITHTVHGLVVPHDIQKLADALKTIYLDKNIRMTMRQENLTLIKNSFDLSVTIQNYMNVYHHLKS